MYLSIRQGGHIWLILSCVSWISAGGGFAQSEEVEREDLRVRVLAHWEEVGRENLPVPQSAHWEEVERTNISVGELSHWENVSMGNYELTWLRDWPLSQEETDLTYL
jgi:hypothetical protein